MVYYIRFLKPPKAEKQGARSLSITTLITLTTDLGDSFMAEDAKLVVNIADQVTQKQICQKEIDWKAGKRELPVTLGPFPVHLAQQTLVLGAAMSRGSHPPIADNLRERGMPVVLSGWSAPFCGLQALVAERFIERRFALKNGLDLRIWEETGNSIARHIWDAALASTLYLQGAIDGGRDVPGALQRVLQNQKNAPTHAIELGSGCGIVGIAMAEMLPRCSVMLTDLFEAEDIAARNISAAKVAPDSSVEYRNLDWDEELPDDLRDTQIDLILVSDCTYNPDSSPALVSILDKLVLSSPNAIILVALKRRHDSEAVFFDLMQSYSFRVMHTEYMTLPSQHDEMEQIELYCYGRKASNHINGISRSWS